MRNLISNLKQNLLNFWHSSKFFRLWVYALSLVAVLAFIAFGVLSLLAKDRVETAQVLFEKDISSTQSLAKSRSENGENFTFLAKLHHFSSPIFRHQRNVSHIKITSISWVDEIDKNAIITKPANNGKDANKFLEIHTSQDLNALKHAKLGVAEYETSFTPVLKSIVLYYFGLILLVFVVLVLWRYLRFYTFLLIAFLVFCDFVVSITDDKLTLVPFGLIGLVGFGLCVFLAFRVKNSKAKLFFAYFSVVPLCLGVMEFYLFSMPQQAIPHPILGYLYTPLYKGRDKIIIVDDKVVRNATYTYDGYGNRITPNNNENSKKCLAIYGCSFAHGSAVNDDETLEFYLAKNLPEFKVLNFGIGGTGAHTALARVQFDIDKNILDKCDELIAIYEAIPHHIYRAYGAFLGPRYELDSNNTPIYWGVYKDGEYAFQRFADNPPKIHSSPTHEQRQKGIFKQIHAFVKSIFSFSNTLDKSYIYKALNENTSFTSKEIVNWSCLYENGFQSNCDYAKLGLNEIGLYFAIVKELDKTLKDKYATPLHIVLWDYDMHAQFLDKYDKTLKENFAKMGVKFWSLSEMIEDYTQDFERVKRGDYDNFKYRVSRWDTHPNALANEKIAEFLAEKIKNGEIKSYPVKQNRTQKDEK